MLAALVATSPQLWLSATSTVCSPSSTSTNLRRGHCLEQLMLAAVVAVSVNATVLWQVLSGSAACRRVRRVRVIVRVKHSYDSALGPGRCRIKLSLDGTCHRRPVLQRYLSIRQPYQTNLELWQRSSEHQAIKRKRKGGNRPGSVPVWARLGQARLQSKPRV